MAEQPEARLQRKIVDKLNQIEGCYCEKVHGSVYGKQKLDIVGGIDGKLFWLEVKTPGNKPTKKQEATMRQWEKKANAFATWATSPEEAEAKVMQLKN